MGRKVATLYFWLRTILAGKRDLSLSLNDCIISQNVLYIKGYIRDDCAYLVHQKVSSLVEQPLHSQL